MKNSLCSLFSSQVVDLTHPLHDRVPTWDGSCGFKKTVTQDFASPSTQTRFQFQCLEMRVGIGTHMDAPLHCIQGGLGISDIDLTQLICPLVVLDISSRDKIDDQISADDILEFERIHGAIPSDALVVGYTGWSRYWNEPIKYRNVDEKGQVYFPSFHAEAAEILLDRRVCGLGIDTLSPDLGLDGQYPVHELFLGAGKYLVENIANAHLLPPRGALGVVLPMKISEGTEAPVRFIAFFN